jgi:hypothetical protein
VTVIADCTTKPVFESMRMSRYVPANRVVGTMNHVVLVNAPVPEADTVCEPNKELATKSTPPNVAVEIAVKPLTVMVTLLPDTAVVGATIVGVPKTLIAASAVSVGLVAVNRSVYAPG